MAVGNELLLVAQVRGRGKERRMAKTGINRAQQVRKQTRTDAFVQRIPVMRVGLMVPCYIDMFYPQVGVATVELLEKLGVEVDYPVDQTCCGQPMANSGAYKEAKATEELFIRNFAGYEHIVAPSGSCVHHLRNKFTAAQDTPGRGSDAGSR
jgi:Fe-S oxidoreductase